MRYRNNPTGFIFSPARFVERRNNPGEFDKGTNTINLEIPLNEISDRDLVYPIGGVDWEIVVRKTGSDYPRTIIFTWAEEILQEQTTAYWVRVLQEDGATAWSSPIFVTPE